ncbi:MAG TPA: Pls/PosA family non-ribosomal peptide synthetase [Streptosporangiaceae bacterium]|nr:Pls/PosA family non-ribosomal peptide synthetase [Streptosporangiaceae bacterium]
MSDTTIEQAAPAGRQFLTGACAGYEGSIRWREGERLEQLFEGRCDWLRRQGRGDHLAVDAQDATLSYAELDARANQLARFLLGRGVRPGDRVGLLFDRAVDGYVGMLAVLKVHAAYVPLDAGFPPDRLSYIASDAQVRLVLSRSHLADRAEGLTGGAGPLYLDEVGDLVAGESRDRLGAGEAGDAVDDLCYVIYTSGSTGRPKGVAIGHASICNFVRVAAEVYGMAWDDRVYQGMTIAFDFSVEEIWVPWMTGATLVPKPGGESLLGAELHAFLRERRVTALCCVPTLLATLEDELPGLRFLLVSGESCPQDLVARWHRHGRRFLNVYGPTEATVTATWTLVSPDRPVTIGLPLPTYSVVVLDPDADRALPPGAMGEIGIAGIGLASGYLNRPELTERAFVPDFLGIPENPSGRIYRTGDLGRVNADGEIEHHGRIDTQVKIRGYRIELTEIESVLLQVPGIAQAVVCTYQPQPDVMELVAYYSPRRDTAAVDASRVYEHLRDRLPGYMVPAYLEQLSVVPTMASGKADRKSLPAPRGPRRLATRDDYVAPATGTERVLADLLASTLGVERVSVDSHFFDELGSNSLLMARFNAAVRQRADVPAVSMKDVYLHPTVRSLAAALAAAGPVSEPAREPTPAAERAAAPTGTPRYAVCGALQLLAFCACACAASLGLDAGATWTAAGSGLLDIYGRLVVFGGGGLLAIGVLSIVAKWVLIGRWKPRPIRVWSMGYLRFWIVKTLIVANPLARLSVGTPLYVLYLRALGAKIGGGVAIFSQHVPVCTDLLTIGPGSVIRKDAFLNGYRARSGVIETGAVTLGSDVFVGEQTVLDIDTTVGDGAQLGHSSALQTGQAVPAGQCWHGSPAQPAEAGYDYRTVAPARCGTLRRATAGTMRLLVEFAVAGPVAAALAILMLAHPPQLAHLLGGHPTVTSWASDRDALVIAAVLVFGLLLLGLLVVSTVPRVLSRALIPGKVYPLYGFHYTVQRLVSRLTNIKSFTYLFGDSSAIVHYLQALGYRLAPVEQSGSNFGMAVKHEMPTLSTVGTGTLVSDGLSLMNAEFSSSSFRVLPAAIGRRNFLGNNIAYPAGGRTGDDCLLATKVMIPTGGLVREGIGLLGSPCFEIPRSVQRDRRFDHLSTGPERQRRLAAKNRHNAATMGLHLLVRYLYVFGLTLAAMCAVGGQSGPAATFASILIIVAFTTGYFVLVERAVTGFRALQPRFCSIYQAPFWRHERFWKVPANAYLHMFDGTPFKGVLWRLLGVQIGHRVFDDGCAIVERTLVSVGSDCALNAGSTVQSHSLEDGIFKSDHITIGTGCAIGTGAFVHYGITMGDGSVLDADSFLMKGENVPPRARWSGNPAIEALTTITPAGASASESGGTGCAEGENRDFGAARGMPAS